MTIETIDKRIAMAEKNKHISTAEIEQDIADTEVEIVAILLTEK